MRRPQDLDGASSLHELGQDEIEMSPDRSPAHSPTCGDGAGDEVGSRLDPVADHAVVGGRERLDALAP